MNDAPVRGDGEFVLYWMIAFRRTCWNFALDRAVEWGRVLGKPLVILEPLRCDYPWASGRLHAFVLGGMRCNAEKLEGTPVSYYPYVERGKGEGRGLLEALGLRACVVVTDDYPSFFLPHMVEAASGKLPVRVEAVDSNGLLPLRATDRVFLTAVSFRRFLQQQFTQGLPELPQRDPLDGLPIPGRKPALGEAMEHWPPAAPELLKADASALAALPVDHQVEPVGIQGGEDLARERLDQFLRYRLSGYHENRIHPDEDATSGLSSYLHFGHISSHEVAVRVMEEEEWTPERIAPRSSGQRAGWWGMGEGAEAFLDQLITWREIGFNMCSKRKDYDQFDSLPDWAKKELLDHASDCRPYTYKIHEFEEARTHDALWNAAQRQLLSEGVMHNTLRMLWGKKILEWSSTPHEALATMIHLNNKYALDGRDPNSYSGISWILGRYDRPWGPPRPVLGKIRPMSSQNTLRKVLAERYLSRFGG